MQNNLRTYSGAALETTRSIAAAAQPTTVPLDTSHFTSSRALRKQHLTKMFAALLWAPVVACSSDTTGLKEGALCTLDSECEGELVCNYAYRPPECHQPGEHGDICFYANECRSALICNAGYNPPQCGGLSKDGEPCGLDLDCAGFEAGVVCNSGYNPPRCISRGGNGAPCALNTDCIDGLICELQIENGEGRYLCTPAPAM